MKMKETRMDVRYMVQLALLIAIELVMKTIGLGSVPVGPLYMSFLTVPIAVGAMLLGPLAGGILGTVFGLVSFKDAITGLSAMTHVFFELNPISTFVLCVITRMLMGVCVGWIFRLLSKVDKAGVVSYLVGAISAPLLNTLFFMGYIILTFYNTEYIQNLVAAKGATNPMMFVILLVGVQGLTEAVVCCAVGSAVAKAVAKVLKN